MTLKPVAIKDLILGQIFWDHTFGNMMKLMAASNPSFRDNEWKIEARDENEKLYFLTQLEANYHSMYGLKLYIRVETEHTTYSDC